MKLCNETVTLYNAYLDKENDCTAYSRTVITGVSWYGTVKSGVNDKGLVTANQYTVRIPVDAGFGRKSYTEPTGYAEAADKRGLFTLNEGDLIVRGAVSEENPTPAALHKHHEVITILSVTDNRRAPNAPHWKVVGA